jgi:cysteine synthase
MLLYSYHVPSVALAAVDRKIKDGTFGANSRILTFNYDTGERYLSIEGLYEA